MSPIRSTLAVVPFLPLLACQPAADDGGAAASDASPAQDYAVVETAPTPVPSGPAPSYPKAAPASGDAMVEAFYPSPMVVHRCLGLAAEGSSDAVKEICTRALEADPGNAEIQAALAAN